MPVHPPVVGELRALFRAGATPSALVRRVAERHAGDAGLDALVRAYFREAFHVPSVRVGPEQVRHAAAGGSLPVLNVTVLPRMVAARHEWDDAAGGSWLDAAAAPDEPPDPGTLPELARSWDRMDDDARRFVARLIDTARTSHDHVAALAALAEQLQQQVVAAPRRAIGA